MNTSDFGYSVVEQLRTALELKFPEYTKDGYHIAVSVSHGTSFIAYVVYCSLYDEDHVFAGFRLTRMSHLGNYAISSDLRVDDDMRGKGIANRFMAAKIKFAQHTGTKLLAYVNAENKAQHHILTKHGWKNIHGNLWEYDPKSFL